ncbi:MAG: DUF4411 family protein [Fretibacterium sp.]|nr:DUF4411 family protein [Fretibacterium sp.]
MTAEKYLLDANILIAPSNSYYSFELAPGFWPQMKKAILADNVLVPDVVYDEIIKGKDNVISWLKEIDGFNPISTKTTSILRAYGDVQNYISDCGLYQRRGIDEWANVDVADPWLIAAAMEQNATIITFETPQMNASSKGQVFKKVKIPDVANHFGIPYNDLFYFMREMGIRWK